MCARASNPRDRRFRYDDYVRIFGYGVVYLAAKIRGGPAGHDRSFVAVRQAGKEATCASIFLKLRAICAGLRGQAAAPIWSGITSKGYMPARLPAPDLNRNNNKKDHQR